MLYAAVAVERAMKVQEVICRVLAGTLTWLQGADILGIHTRSLRRWRARYERDGVLGLYDGRRGQPSRRKAPVAEVQRILRLYRDRYGPRDGHPGFNVRHFYHLARRDHGVTLSYTFVKLALQEAGLVRKGRTRGRHRRRREPRPCFGELLHLDGSRHAWLALCPAERQTLVAVLDDATKRLLYAQLWPGETTAAVMSALRVVFQTYGLPIALYTDRAGWAFYTPTAGGKVDLTRPTQLGRALTRLGIEHIPSYSPQGRGRGVNGRPSRATQGHPSRASAGR
jgi:transposase